MNKICTAPDFMCGEYLTVRFGRVIVHIKTEQVEFFTILFYGFLVLFHLYFRGENCSIFISVLVLSIKTIFSSC